MRAVQKLLLYQPTIQLPYNKVGSDSTVAGYRQYDRNLIPCWGRKFFLSHCIQIGSWAHPALY